MIARLAVLLAGLMLTAAPAGAFCRTPEAIISGFDHSQVEASFTPLYGSAGLDAIARTNEILAATDTDGRVEGSAVLIAEPRGDDIFYVYTFRDNCHVGTAWFARDFINLVLGKGA